MHDIHELLALLWKDYAGLNPQVGLIHHLLESRGETIRNDHVAFRTYRDERVGLSALAAAFERHGYKACGEYEFIEKKLDARHYEHPDGDLPKVFISELKLELFDDAFRDIVKLLLDQVPDELPTRWDFPASGRPWQVSYADYEALREHSEYGAWVAAFGFRANHFTVSVNALNSFDSLEQLNAYLKDHGILLNTTGGEIKGSRDVYLEQSSTLADHVTVEFSDEPRHIPACYYEFALRHEMPDGRLFSGFVIGSADKIFHSTDRQ